MKSNVTDFDGLHDVLVELDGKSRSDEELLKIFHTLPSPIQMIAHEWSCSDTVFRDQAFVYLQKNMPHSSIGKDVRFST